MPGRKRSEDPPGTVRVMMVWPQELKDRVREVAGPRGLTEFVIAAVEHALAEAPAPAPAPDDVPTEVTVTHSSEAETAPIENEQASEPVVEEPVSVEPPEVPFTKTNKTPTTHLPVDLPHDVQGRDDLFAKLMAKTGGKLEAFEEEKLKANLKQASAIDRPDTPEEIADQKATTEALMPGQMEAMAVQTQEKCPNCGEEMVDGECWTCA